MPDFSPKPNFCKKLWNWCPGVQPRALAEEVMRQVLQYVDVVIANEEDASDVLDIHAGDTDVQAGKVSVEKYPAVAREIVRAAAVALKTGTVRLAETEALGVSVDSILGHACEAWPAGRIVSALNHCSRTRYIWCVSV